MTPERLEQIRRIEKQVGRAVTADCIEVLDDAVSDLLAEIDRLRAPVDDVEVAKCLISLTNACRCDGDTECTFCGTVTFITRLVRERDQLKWQQFAKDTRSEAAEAKAARLSAALISCITSWFDDGNCKLCGYNGQRYYQPDTHPCAVHFHTARALEKSHD